MDRSSITHRPCSKRRSQLVSAPCAYVLVFVALYNLSKLPWMIVGAWIPSRCPYHASPALLDSSPSTYIWASGSREGHVFLIIHVILAVYQQLMYACVLHPGWHHFRHLIPVDFGLCLFVLTVTNVAVIYPWRDHIGSLASDTSWILNMLALGVLLVGTTTHCMLNTGKAHKASCWLLVVICVFELGPMLDAANVWNHRG